MASLIPSSKRPRDPSADVEVDVEAEAEAERSVSPSLHAGPSTSQPKPKRKKSEKNKSSSSSPSPGIVYISRLPPGMTPQKVKHLMERWGDVGRIYAQKKDPAVGKKPKHEKANYSEAWVEFLNKKMAKTVAEMLNAQVIGGKKGDRWRDDIWTMKYLSGFKWEMLGEQVAYDRQAHTSRLRQSLSQSKTEQAEYLRNVELARVLDKRRVKRAEKEGDVGTGASSTSIPKPDKAQEAKSQRNYRQRGMAGNGSKSQEGSGGAMNDVLDSLF